MAEDMLLRMSCEQRYRGNAGTGGSVCGMESFI